MKVFILVLLLLLPIFNTSVFAGTTHFVHLKATNAKQRSEIAKYIHIDQVIENSVYAVVNENDLKELKKHFKNQILETHVYSRSTPGLANDEIEFPKKDEKFHTYKEVVTVLNDLSSKFPKITERFSVGTSLEGRDIPGIKISTLSSKNASLFNPAILFLGTHHAREHLSTEVPLLLAKYLIENYQTNSDIKKLIDSREIYFIPMVNPDGAMYDIKGRKYKSWRKNRATNHDKSHGVDLNRNYSFGWGTDGSSKNPRSDVYMGPKPFSEPETLAVKSFIESKTNIRILLSFHTFSELILYPWGGKNTGVGGKDQKVFEKMAKTMSKWNGYKPEQASDLYIASGDTCDWAYGTQSIFCFTFELSPKSIWGGGFYPGAKAIDKTFKVNIKPALYLIEKAADPYGVLSESK